MKRDEMTKKKREFDFQDKTKRIIAGRAGYQCSIPGCNKLTIGPGKEHDEIINKGDAAHIFSGAKNGPRGNGGLSLNDLKSPENGIWLCNNHHTIIDSNKGNQYPAPLLISFKNLHEQRIALKLENLTNPVGWIQEIEILKSQIFKKKVNIKLGKVTLFMGGAAIGKTTSCTLILGAFNFNYLERWFSNDKTSEYIAYNLKYYNPEEQHLHIDIDSGKIKLLINDKRFAFNPHNFFFINLNQNVFFTGQDILDYLSDLFSIDKIVFINLFDNSSELMEISMRKPIIKYEDNKYLLEIEQNDGLKLPFSSLSGGEKTRVVLDIAIGLAKFVSQYKYTMLILDWSSLYMIDDNWMNYYVKYLNRADLNFQTIIVLSNKRKKVKWNGWQIVKFYGEKPNIIIDQEKLFD